MTGIGGQSDGALPLLDGYTLMPRSLDDLTDPVVSSFEVPEVINLGGAPVFAVNESENANLYQWSFGNGTFSNEEEPELLYTEPGTYNIYLTATDQETQCSDQSWTTVVVEGVMRSWRLRTLGCTSIPTRLRRSFGWSCVSL